MEGRVLRAYRKTHLPSLLAAAVTTSILTSGCATRLVSGRPAFPTRVAASPGEWNIALEAKVFGTLMLKGRCLGIGKDGEYLATIIWPETARLLHDRQGLLIRDRSTDTIIRIGDYLEGGGGAAFSNAPISAVLTEALPTECGGTVISLNPGFQKKKR
jgi:hypothetical protein